MGALMTYAAMCSRSPSCCRGSKWRDQHGQRGRGRYALDVVVNDAALVEELDAREEGAEPLLGVLLGYLDSDEPGMIRPTDRK